MCGRHADGPWEIDSRDGVILVNGKADKRGNDLVCGIKINQDLGGFRFAYDKDTANANAKLIASAPDMLFALKSIYDKGFLEIGDLRSIKKIITRAGSI